jgi:hypothetical protein
VKARSNLRPKPPAGRGARPRNQKILCWGLAGRMLADARDPAPLGSNPEILCWGLAWGMLADARDPPPLGSASQPHPFKILNGSGSGVTRV